MQMLLCVGEFFGADKTEWELYKSGQEKGRQNTSFIIMYVCMSYIK